MKHYADPETGLRQWMPVPQFRRRSAWQWLIDALHDWLQR